jgi:trigger factor
LKIETHHLEDHQVKLTAEVEPERFEQAKRRAARKIAKKTKIPGFRPGKAPFHIVQRFVGDNAIFEDGLEILIKELYPEIIEQAEINPYGPGNLENIVELEPLTLEFVIPLAAEVTLGDYVSLRSTYEPKEITETDVDETLNRLRESQAIEEPVDRPAEDGDRVFVRLQATKVNASEGEEATIIPERQVPFLISLDEENDSQSWPFSGFTKELIGLSAGDKKNLIHTFPEDIEFENLQGVSAEFQVEVEEVKSHTLPEVDDEFAQSVGEFENAKTMLQQIQQELEQQAKTEYNNEYNEGVISQVVEMSEVKYPPQMLENEIDEVIHQLEHRLKNQNLDLETYMKVRELDEQGLRDDAKPMAESRLKQSLVLMEISKAENIELDQVEVQQETARAYEAMTNYMPEADLRKVPQDQLITNLLNNVMVEMRLRKTVERLQLIARGEYLSNEIEAEQQESDNMESTKLTKEDDKSSSPEEDVDPEETVFEEKQSPEVEDI